MANLDPNRLQNLHRYWQAANYLTIGQIYLQENPLPGGTSSTVQAVRRQ